MAQLMAVSSSELVAALEDAGFERASSESDGSLVMTRAETRVTFQPAEILPPEILSEVLRAARLPVGQLIESIDAAGKRRSRSTKPPKR